MLLVLIFAVCSAFAQQGSSVITQIDIVGNQNVTKDAILSRMKTKVGQPYVQAQLDQDKAAIEQMGFFKAVDVVANSSEAPNYKVTVTVSEFAIVKEFRIVGNDEKTMPTEKIQKALTIQIGKPFNLTEQKPSGDAIAKLYNDKGYFARVEQLEPLEESPSTVSIVIREQKVHSVSVQGAKRTRPGVLRRLIKTKPGEAFNIRKWDDDMRRLYGTHWFEEPGGIQPIERQNEDGSFDLIADVKEARTGQVAFGVTLDPHNSFAGTLRLFDTNFAGSGQTVGLDYLQAINGNGPSVDLNYTNPFMDYKDTSMSVDLFSRLIYRFTGNSFGGGAGNSPVSSQYIERHTGGSLGFARPVGSRATVSTGIRIENIKTSNLDTTQTNDFIQQDGSVGIFSLGYNINRRDLDSDPSRGDWFNILAEPGMTNITKTGGLINDPAILGHSSFFRATSEYRAYYTPQPPRGRNLDAPRRVFALRVKAGTITGKVPFFEQFFAGGSDTVRGYEDDRFWGKNILTTTLEYRHPLQKAFNVIGFVDYGGAWGGYGTVNKFSQSDKFKLHLGYGAGLSFKTPLGPLRLDFAFNDRGKSRTHFLIGTSF